MCGAPSVQRMAGRGRPAGRALLVLTSVLAAVWALSAAAAWGAGDFAGGLVARRMGAFFAVLGSYTVGLLALTIVALARGEAFPPAQDVLWGAVAGLAGVMGLGFLLRGFAEGRMGIVAPVSAVLTASIPVVAAALTEGMPRALQLVGFGVALAGLWLLSRPQQHGGRPGGPGVALLARGGGGSVCWEGAGGCGGSAGGWLAAGLCLGQKVSTACVYTGCLTDQKDCSFPADGAAARSAAWSRASRPACHRARMSQNCRRRSVAPAACGPPPCCRPPAAPDRAAARCRCGSTRHRLAAQTRPGSSECRRRCGSDIRRPQSGPSVARSRRTTRAALGSNRRCRAWPVRRASGTGRRR